MECEPWFAIVDQVDPWVRSLQPHSAWPPAGHISADECDTRVASGPPTRIGHLADFADDVAAERAPAVALIPNESQAAR